jgi:hypothetical protein
MSPAIQKWVMILLGIGAVGLAALLATKSYTPAPPVALAPVDAGADAKAVVDAAAAATIASDSGAEEPDSSLLLSDRVETESRVDSGIWGRFEDGTPVPPLPADAPRKVRLGIILVQYAGAEGAPANARSKADAKALAEKLAAQAQTDFSGAVQGGDTGSSSDIGSIRRGGIELAPEYVAFSLKVGGVSEHPVDTPRGYWIVKRVE